MITATCHCGSVRLEVDEKPESLTECNCSICHRYGALWAYYTRQTARMLSAPELMQAYLWGDRIIEFYHCKNCGCITHYEDVEKNPDSRIAVNTRMMPPEEIAGISVRKFDGASSWKFLEQ
jgi:hypothetical protein